MGQNFIKKWVTAVRPYSLPASVIPVFAASALAYSEGGFNIAIAAICALFALLMQCTANLVNDLYDAKKGADREDRLGPDRLYAKGVISLREIRWAIAIFTVASVAVGSLILFYAPLWLIFVGLGCVVAAYLYTASPISFAYNGLGDVAVVIFYGVVPACVTYYLQTGAIGAPIIIISVACGAVIDTMLMVNNFRDRREDAECGKRTIVVMLGERFGRWAYFALGFLAMALTLSLLGYGILWGALLPLLYFPLFFATWLKMVRISSGERLNESLGETARNMLIFGALLTIGLALG